jgi:CRP-like cAMP-binding protein/Pyruvate/2-oxoacid:ferredoxin oxidoreductase delta subunit
MQELIDNGVFVKLFPQFSEDDCEYLIENSNILTIPAGTAVCREGEYGDTSFAIMKGEVEICINADGHENLTLALLEEGNIFGEMAALSGQPRNATVTAKDELTVLEIPPKTLKGLMKKSQGFKDSLENLYSERAVHTYLRKVPFFAKLSPTVLEQLENRVKLLTYKQGDIIFREGEVGNSLYIIRSGFVKVSKKQEDKEKIIAYICHGNYFGEMALVEDEKRSATISAFTKTEVIQVLKDDFNDLIKSESNMSEMIQDLMIERKLNTFEVLRDSEKAERLEAIVERGIIQADNLLIIDLKRCINCNNCVKSCESRHGYPRLDRKGTRIAEISVPVACRVCHDPLCLTCNFDAIKRAPSGEVHVIDDKCIGVSGCAIRCPYNVIKMVSTKSESGPKWFDIIGTLMRNKQETEADEKGAGKPKINRKRMAIKCDNCMGYSDTACTNNCPTHAIKWVNPVEYFEDSENIISEKKKYQ